LAGFYENFDHGTGIFNNTWGKVDTSVHGQITLRGNSGAMQTGGGNGYGHYEVTAKMSANVQGPAALLWPANNKWPGPEYDIVEVISGHPYGTVHWNNHGKDAYATSHWNQIDETQKHTYALDWHGNKIDYSVDGRHVGSINHGGKDAGHGGINELMSLMNRDFESDHAYLTVYSASYDPWG
jgi:Glycosyl hydrolases family 16